MKIKVIDLLVKMANNEKIPKKIKYRDKIWQYTTTVRGRGYQYYSVYYQEWKTLQNQVYLEECLNDEVEIIEEDNKMVEIEIDKIVSDTDEDDKYFIEENDDRIYIGEKCDDDTKCKLYLIRKINEIIKKVNETKE